MGCSSTNFESDSTETNHTNYESIYHRLLFDFDESVSKPLMTLIDTEDTEDTIQFIESSDLLSRPSRLLTANSENEVLIEGRSDTASINQARLKNISLTTNCNNKFPGLLNTDETEFKIVDVDEVADDIEDISDDEEDEDVMDVDDDKENNKLLCNQQPQQEYNTPSDSSNSSE